MGKTATAKQVDEMCNIICKLYESFATGNLTEKRFDLLPDGYERDQEALDTFEADTARVDQSLALAKKYTDFSVLTTPMIYEFVDRILVHAPDRSTGNRTQEVEICLEFIGKVTVPMQEPTAEELAEMEKRRKQRAYYRERGRRQRKREQARRLSGNEKSA